MMDGRETKWSTPVPISQTEFAYNETVGLTATHTAFFMGGGTEVISDGVTETVRKYYALAAPLAALGGAPLRYASSTFGMSDKGVMKYLISDHLGSTVAITDNTGALLAETRYLPFGEPRADTGSLAGTDKTFTGQRDVPDTGLMDYRARMYSPGLGRFIQPDTIVPGAGNSQAWNRYAYSLNNPVNFTDPSGHKPCSPTNEGTCETFEEDVIKMLDKLEKLVNVKGMDKDNNGFPETPDIKAMPVTIGTDMYCKQSTYTECFYSRELFDISQRMKIDENQMALLMIAVYYDLNKRQRGINDRANYDTPFWDYYGEAPGDACFGGKCFKRQEVNYFAQGMYTNANGESRNFGLVTVYAWKLVKYIEMPSDGTIFWFDIGYLVYSIIMEGR